MACKTCADEVLDMTQVRREGDAYVCRECGDAYYPADSEPVPAGHRLAAETIRCLCAKCRAFTDHTIPDGKCTVCNAPIPTEEAIASMADVPRETLECTDCSGTDFRTEGPGLACRECETWYSPSDIEALERGEKPKGRYLSPADEAVGEEFDVCKALFILLAKFDRMIWAIRALAFGGCLLGFYVWWKLG